MNEEGGRTRSSAQIRYICPKSGSLSSTRPGAVPRRSPKPDAHRTRPALFELTDKRGSDRGGERAASMYTLIVTAKLNGIDPQAWLADVSAPHRRSIRHPALISCSPGIG